MKRVFAVIHTAIAVVGAARADAQELPAGPGRVEISIIPAGALFFTKDTDAAAPSFGNYDAGTAVAVNFNRYIGVEGELSGAFGLTQSLEFAGLSADRRTPHIANYSGNVVLSAPTAGRIVPYVAGGVGALSVFERAELGIADTTTFLTGNVGGGVKWYAGRWGVRADYRFVTVRSKDDAPEFFGTNTRYGHRVYGALLLNVGR